MQTVTRDLTVFVPFPTSRTLTTLPKKRQTTARTTQTLVLCNGKRCPLAIALAARFFEILSLFFKRRMGASVNKSMRVLQYCCATAMALDSFRSHARHVHRNLTLLALLRVYRQLVHPQVARTG